MVNCNESARMPALLRWGAGMWRLRPPFRLCGVASLAPGSPRPMPAGTIQSLTKACRAVIAARDNGSDPFAAVDRDVGWQEFLRAVAEAEAFAAPAVEGDKSELIEKYPSIRMSNRAICRSGRASSRTSDIVSSRRRGECFWRPARPSQAVPCLVPPALPRAQQSLKTGRVGPLGHDWLAE
jgi:hypothetical protein